VKSAERTNERTELHGEPRPNLHYNA